MGKADLARLSAAGLERAEIVAEPGDVLFFYGGLLVLGSPATPADAPTRFATYAHWVPQAKFQKGTVSYGHQSKTQEMQNIDLRYFGFCLFVLPFCGASTDKSFLSRFFLPVGFPMSSHFFCISCVLPCRNACSPTLVNNMSLSLQQAGS